MFVGSFSVSISKLIYDKFAKLIKDTLVKVSEGVSGTSGVSTFGPSKAIEAFFSNFSASFWSNNSIGQIAKAI